MITKGTHGNNEPGEVIHRFHKRESCVFHSIHRLLTSLREGGCRRMCEPLPGSVPNWDIYLSQDGRRLVPRDRLQTRKSIDTAETARI